MADLSSGGRLKQAEFGTFYRQPENSAPTPEDDAQTVADSEQPLTEQTLTEIRGSEAGGIRTGLAELMADESAAELIARAGARLIHSQQG